MGWTEDDVRAILQNPVYAITISSSLSVPHEPLITRDQWVQANAKLIEEMGPILYLQRLLEVLETGGLSSEGRPPYG